MFGGRSNYLEENKPSIHEAETGVFKFSKTQILSVMNFVYEALFTFTLKRSVCLLHVLANRRRESNYQ